MCDNCMKIEDISPNLYDVLGLLENQELSKYRYKPIIDRRLIGVWSKEGDFGRGEFHEVDVPRLENLCDTYRNYCWHCIRQIIQENMGWDFTLLESGIPLNEHQSHLKFLEGINKLSDPWRETFRTLVLNEGHNISWFTSGLEGDLQRLLHTIQANKLTPQIFVEINKHLLEILDETLVWEPFEFLLRLIECGYTAIEDLRMLCGERFMYELFDHAYFEAMPPQEIASKAGGLVAYLKYRDVLYNVDDDCSLSEEAERIEVLLNLDISIEELSSLGQSFLSEDFNIFTEDLFEDIENMYGTNEFVLFEAFVKTIEMMNQIKMPITSFNIHKYFGVSGESALRAIDFGETNPNFYRAARWFAEIDCIENAKTFLDSGVPIEEVFVLVNSGVTPEIFDAVEARGVSVAALTELVKKEPQFPCGALLLWLDAGFGADSLDEMLEWWRAGFTPANVASWRELGFNALEASVWLRHTTDPVVAWRRKKAGISPAKE